ncbi:MAG: host attachment protein [Kiloniellales bacterium]|nr:host attachment protein [Kiloniellales bacterium]
MKARKKWVVVADARNARVFELRGKNKSPAQIQGALFEAPREAGQDVFSSRPGRVFDSHGAGRHGMEPSTSAEDQGRENFVRTIASWLEKPGENGDFDSLILVAAPKTLGELRKQLSTALRIKVEYELDKDLTKSTDEEVVEALGSRIVI